MNFKLVLYILGWILKFEAAFLCLPAVVGLFYKEFKEVLIYLAVALLCLLIGTACSLLGRKATELYPREGFLSVSLGWLVISAFGALPFLFTGEIPNVIDALFETVSGFTTTGSSILTDVEALSYTSLFWRSFTHWIGGMGVFVFVMAILPMMGGSTMNLMKAESTGPSIGKLVPRTKDTAKILYSIYIGITLVQIIIMVCFGAPLFDAMTLTFGSVGTGGFGIKNDSMASYRPAIQNIVTIFMILSGVNYSAYFLLLRRQLKEATSLEEVRAYFAIILTAAAIIIFDTRHIYETLGETIRHAFFQVGTIITTTGYATTDYDIWPTLSKTVLILLMFIGACAGSTAGGIKISRMILLFKSIRKELSLMVHPKLVKKIKVDEHPVSNEVLRTTTVFISLYFVIFFVSLLLVSLDNLDFTSTFTAVAATLNNIGPGFAAVGPTQNFSAFSGFSKGIMIFNMLAGRLELFPILILFYPPCWKKY